MENKTESFRYESRCDCGKLLTKPMVKIQVTREITSEMVRIAFKSLKISYGAQTMCRRCKKTHETIRESSVKDLLVNNQ